MSGASRGGLAFRELFLEIVDRGAAAEEFVVLQEFLVQREILTPLGYYDDNAPPEHAVYGLHLQPQPDGSHQMEFWYRQRDRGYLTPSISAIWRGPNAYTTSMSNPLPFASGMVNVRIDMNGRLIEMLAVPNDNRPLLEGDSANLLSQLFQWAHLSLDDFEEVRDSKERPTNW